MLSRMPRLAILIACGGLFGSAASSLASRAADTQLCDTAAQNAAHSHAVPLDILLAITRVETGRRSGQESQPWPWAINQGGQGHWFDDATAAIAFANAQLAAGNGNFDVGCFQINLHWHGAHFASIDAAFDPQSNADFAAEFLTQLFASEGSWEKAVAAYHSRTPDEAAAYLTKVEAVLTNLPKAAGQTGTDPQYAMATEAVVRVNNFPLLRSGLHGNGASLVPVTDGGSPLFAMAP